MKKSASKAQVFSI